MNVSIPETMTTREAERVSCRSHGFDPRSHVGRDADISGLGEPPKFDLRAYEGATRPRELSTLATAIHTPMWARLPPYWISGEPPKVRSTGLRGRGLPVLATV